MQYGTGSHPRTCMCLRTSEAVATPAFGPHMGSPSSAFSATFKRVRKMAMPLATSDRATPRSVPVLPGRGVCAVGPGRLSAEVARVAVVPVGAVHAASSSAVEAAGGYIRLLWLNGRWEDEAAWLGVARAGGGDGLRFLERGREGGSGDLLFLFGFLENLLKKEDDEDMVEDVNNDAQIVS
jgi:hypothetical protein